MARNHYRNGDNITLEQTGRDEDRECAECGAGFGPETPRQTCCTPHCHAMYHGLDCDCEDCQESLDTEKYDDC